jgi:hypothetical protein
VVLLLIGAPRRLCRSRRQLELGLGLLLGRDPPPEAISAAAGAVGAGALAVLYDPRPAALALCGDRAFGAAPPGVFDEGWGLGRVGVGLGWLICAIH